MKMNHKILLASTAILSFTSLMASGKLNPKGNPACQSSILFLVSIYILPNRNLRSASLNGGSKTLNVRSTSLNGHFI